MRDRARIEFCGGIAAGKSTCATLLATHWSLPLVTEDFEGNPYWRNNLQNASNQSLETDLNFLLAHARDIEASSAAISVCDFAMFQTVAYSSLAGVREDTRTVRAVLNRLIRRLGHPSLIVRVRCPTDLQLERILRRGRAPEARMTVDYLARLDDAIDRQLRHLAAGPIVIDVDTTKPPRDFLRSKALNASMMALGAVESPDT